MKSTTLEILLVEDDEAEAKLVVQETDKLRGPKGFVVARSLAEGIRQLSRSRFDVVVLDLGLPDSQGVETLRRIRAHAPETPIVVLSGSQDVHIGEQARKEGALEYVEKGVYTGPVLAAAIDHAMDLKAALHEAKSRQEAYRALAEHSPDLIVRLDRKLGIEYANPSFAKAVGRATSDVQGQPLANVGLDATALDLWSASVRKVFETGNACLLEFHHAPPGQSARTYQAHLVPERAESKVQRVLCVARDVTEWEAASERLAALNETLERRVDDRTRDLARAVEELDAFTRSVSHDLRAPLRGIDILAEAIEQDHPDLPPDVHAHLRRLRAEATHARQLVEGLLALSRATTDVLERRRVDLTAHATRIVERLKAMDPTRDVEVDIHPGMEATGDPILLDVVLQNLLSNAWKFTARTPQARITFHATRDESGQSTYTVEDNGAGFPSEKASSLFKPFTRLHAAADFGGTGIGLATVRRIIERHGGTVRARGEPGKGAAFSFTLPATPWGVPA